MNIFICSVVGLFFGAIVNSILFFINLEKENKSCFQKETQNKNIFQEKDTAKEEKENVKVNNVKFIITIPDKKTGICICGCNGKKLHYQVNIEDINIGNYPSCPARYARKENEKRTKLIKKQKELDNWSYRENYSLPAKSKEEAVRRSLKTYLGKRCLKCGSNIKRLSYACKPCFDAERKLREAMKRGAYPENLTENERKQIVQIYKKSKLKTVETGIEHHVDHIQPLAKGGRHHPSNLQIITAKENLRKGAKWKG